MQGAVDHRSPIDATLGRKPPEADGGSASTPTFCRRLAEFENRPLVGLEADAPRVSGAPPPAALAPAKAPFCRAAHKTRGRALLEI